MLEGQSTSAAKGMVKKACPREGGGPSSKAAAFLTRGAYSQYVSTAKRRPACAKRFGEGRERRWRLFSTFPFEKKWCAAKMILSLFENSKKHSIQPPFRGLLAYQKPGRVFKKARLEGTRTPYYVPQGVNSLAHPAG
jgi:hypothetical protein